MARKKDVVKKIDQKTKASGAPLPLIQEDQPTPPAFHLIPAPDTLVELAQAIQRSTQAPLVSVAIKWNEAPNINPDYYNIDVSETSDFNEKIRRRALGTTATIEGLKANGATYYIRVQAVIGGIYSEFSETLTVVTMDDDTPPANVTGAAAAFQNSDLVITYVIPISEVLKDVEIKIYNLAHTILYATLYSSAERVVWTAEQNIFATGGVPLKQVSVDIQTRSWNNTYSTTTVNVTATAPIPATPTGYTSNWIGDSGTASADFITAWLGAANANDYELTIDGKNYYTRDLKFVYSYEQNVADHAPTIPSGDPSFIWLLKARDKLGQVSTPVNVTVTNAAPPSGIMNISVTPGFGTLGVTVSLIGNTIVQDFDHFEWRVWNGSSYVRTINSPDSTIIFDLSGAGAGTYTPSVTMVDKFNQRSVTVSGAPQVLDVLTIEQLRAETTYTDWVGTAANVLLRLKDGVLYDGSGAYVFYAPNAGWQWLEAQRPLLDRYKTVTFSAFWGAGLLMYYEVDTPTGTVYYAGPATINANGSYQLTRYTVLATAQANAYAFGTAGNGTRRFDFTRIEESRRIRMWFKDTVSNTGIYEYYARRLVQSDDIEVETIRSINIAALGINADRVFAVTLSAFTAFIGQLNIDATGWLYQGSGTGSSPVTGLKIFNSGGIGKLSTYNAGVEQVTFDTDGKLKAGAGNVILDASGIVLLGRQVAEYTGVTTAPNVIAWKVPAISASNGSSLETIWDAGTNSMKLMITAGISGFGGGTIIARATSSVIMWAGVDATQTNNSSISANAGAGGGITIKSGSAGNIRIQNGNSIAANIQNGLFYPGDNQFSYYLRDSVFSPFFLSGLYTNSNLLLGDKLYPGNQSSYYLDNDSSGLFINGDLRVGSAMGINVNHGVLSIGDQAVDFLPTISNWTTGGSTMLLSAKDFASIGFHDAGSRVDFIVGGGGIIRVGYDGGWGPAVTTMPGGARIGPTGLYIGSSLTAASALIHLSADSSLKPTTSTWGVVSDSRSKQSVADRASALDRVKKMKVKDFIFNGKFGTEKDKKSVGVVAEELALIYPESVQAIEIKNDDGTVEQVLTVNYHEPFVDALAAIQELEARLAVLEAKNKK